MSYIEEQLNAIANSLETHAELMKYSNSWSIAKSADAIRELAKQHTEQLAEVEKEAQTEIDELKAQAVEDAGKYLLSLVTAPPSLHFASADALYKRANQLRQQAKRGDL